MWIFFRKKYYYLIYTHRICASMAHLGLVSYHPPRHTPTQIFPVSVDSSSEEELTVQDIIRCRPSTKDVREFMRDHIQNMTTEEDEMFM